MDNMPVIGPACFHLLPSTHLPDDPVLPKVIPAREFLALVLGTLFFALLPFLLLPLIVRVSLAFPLVLLMLPVALLL